MSVNVDNTYTCCGKLIEVLPDEDTASAFRYVAKVDGELVRTKNGRARVWQTGYAAMQQVKREVTDAWHDQRLGIKR